MLSCLLVSFLLFQPPNGKPGVTVGGKYTQSEITKAQEILAANAPKELKLNLGEFEVVEPDKNTKSPLQFQYLSNKTYFLWRVKPGQSFGLAGVRRGDKERQMYFFDAKPYEWAIIEARAEGNEVIVVNRNGANRDVDPPEEIDRVNVIVGNPKPPTPPGPNPPDPVVPVNDALAVAAKSDIKAGKGTADDVAAFSSLFTVIAGQLSNGQQFDTIGDFYAKLKSAGQTMVGDPAKVLPTMREAVAQELDKKLSTKPGDKFEPNRAAIVAALYDIGKRLQGVK